MFFLQTTCDPSSVVVAAILFFVFSMPANQSAAYFRITCRFLSKMAGTSFNFGRILLQPSVVFFRSKLSFAFVNRKPVLAGHVLVSPVRVVKRFCELTEEEVADLFYEYSEGGTCSRESA